MRLNLWLSILMIFSHSIGAQGLLGSISTNVEVLLFNDDNVGRAQYKDDIHKDTGYSLRGSLVYSKILGPLSSLSLEGGAELEEFEVYDGLSNTQGFLTVSYSFLTRVGFSAPHYRAFLTIDRTDANTDIRDAESYLLGFEMRKRITDKISTSYGLSTSTQEAKGEVFDLERVRLFANLDYTLTPRIVLYATYSYIDGDVVSTATGNVPRSLSMINNSDAIEPDNAFGGLATGQFAYRLDAKTQIFNLGSNIAINSKQALDLSVELLNSKKTDETGIVAAPGFDANIEYERRVLRAVYLMRF